MLEPRSRPLLVLEGKSHLVAGQKVAEFGPGERYALGSLRLGAALAGAAAAVGLVEMGVERAVDGDGAAVALGGPPSAGVAD